MKQITPFLWFDANAEEAVNTYLTLFPRSKLMSVSRYGDAGPGPKGSVMTMEFELNGQRFVALNGGPHYKFSPATSFVVNCETQAEIDELWEKLSASGAMQQCGWLTDRFGVTWQIVPAMLGELLGGGGDAARAARVTKAMLAMVKLDIKRLQAAYEHA